MNWRRGIFRLWLAASAIWIVAITAIAYQAGAFTLPPPPAGFVLDNQLEDVRLFPVWALGPPLVLGLAMLVIGWIFAGFRPHRPS
jgi:hypothetical protein